MKTDDRLTYLHTLKVYELQFFKLIVFKESKNYF